MPQLQAESGRRRHGFRPNPCRLRPHFARGEGGRRVATPAVPVGKKSGDVPAGTPPRSKL